MATSPPSKDFPNGLFAFVCDERGCDFCDSTGSVESFLDSRLQEKCPMCHGLGRAAPAGDD